MGDLSENADYIMAKEDQAFLEGRILELEGVLRSATIVASGDGGARGHRHRRLHRDGEGARRES